MSEQAEARGQRPEVSLRPRTFVGAGATFSLLSEASDKADAWNAARPIETPVIYWPHGFACPARIGRTRSRAVVIGKDGAYTAVVYVNGHGDAVSLGFVAEITPANMRGHLNLEFTSSVILDLELGGSHVVTDLHRSIDRAVAPLHEALAAQLQHESQGAGPAVGQA